MNLLRLIMALLIIISLFGSCSKKNIEIKQKIVASKNSTSTSSFSSSSSSKEKVSSSSLSSYKVIPSSSKANSLTSSNVIPSSSKVNSSTSSNGQTIVPKVMSNEEEFLNSVNAINVTVNAGVLAYDGNFIYRIVSGKIVKTNAKTGEKIATNISSKNFFICGNTLLSKDNFVDNDWLTWHNLTSGRSVVIVSGSTVIDYSAYGNKAFYTSGQQSSTELYPHGLGVFDINQSTSGANTGITQGVTTNIDFYQFFTSGRYLYAKGLDKPAVNNRPNYNFPVPYDYNGFQGIRVDMETLEVKDYGANIEFIKPSSCFDSNDFVVYKNKSENALYLLENKTGKVTKLPASISQNYAIINNQIISSGDFFSILENKIFSIKSQGHSLINNKDCLPNFFNGGVSYYFRNPYITSSTSYFTLGTESSTELRNGEGATSAVFKLDNWIYTITKRFNGNMVVATFASSRFKADDFSVYENNY